MNSKMDWKNLILHPNNSSKTESVPQSGEIVINDGPKSTSAQGTRSLIEISQQSVSPSTSNIKNTLIPVYCVLLSLVIIILAVYVVYKFLKQRGTQKKFSKTPALSILPGKKNSGDFCNQSAQMLKAPSGMCGSLELEELIRCVPNHVMLAFMNKHNLCAEGSLTAEEAVRRWMLCCIVPESSSPSVMMTELRSEFDQVCEQHNIMWRCPTAIVVPTTAAATSCNNNQPLLLQPPLSRGYCDMKNMV